jgi:hypothetical protein
VTKVVDGRLWAFRAGSPELAEFEAGGELAKHVIRPAGGPLGLTVKSPDTETLDAYVRLAVHESSEPAQAPSPTSYDKPGFVTFIRDGRLWVFRTGSDEIKEFKEVGEPAKHVTRPGGGPRGITIKAPDVETIEAYLKNGG